MKYPINYDFGKNWKTKIISHLNNPKLLESIHEGVNDYLLDAYDSNKYKYRNNTIPAIYCRTDTYNRIINRQKGNLLEKLRLENKLPKKFLELEKEYIDITEDNNNNEDTAGILHLLMMYEDKILKPYFSYKQVNNRLESYILYDGCHSWAPTFELTLAQLVEPEEEWSVRTGKFHSSVINSTHTQCFDLIYWATDRLNNYLFDDPLDSVAINDITLGGREAYIDSS